MEQKLAGVVAISNPLSGKNKRGGFESFAKQITAYTTIDHLVTSNEAEIVQALNQCKQRGVAIIIVNGGDGTLQCVLSFLKQDTHLDYTPELLLLQAGTTSMAFGDVGCKAPLQATLEGLIAYVDGQKTPFKKSARAVIKMTLPATQQSQCGLFFGAGAIHTGILYCRQRLHTRGMRGELGASLAMFRFIIDWLTVKRLATAVQAKITIDNKYQDQGRYNIITATTLMRLLAGVYPFWAPVKHADSYALTLIKYNPPRPIMNFLRILRGRAPHSQQQHYQSYSVRTAELDIHGGFTLDGELFGEADKNTRVHIAAAGMVTFLSL